MTAGLILKIFITAVLVIGNLVWLFVCFMANLSDPKGEWDHSIWGWVFLPTGINVLIVWSMWE